MIQAKCIEKFRDKNNNIYGYKLQDLNGETQNVKPDNLKRAILNKEINVINLTLTSDMRLVDKSEDKLKSAKLGEEPTAKVDNELLKIAKILCNKCGYTVDKKDINKDSVIIRKSAKLNTYMYISFEGEENIIDVTLGSRDFGFEKSIKIYSRTDIEKLYTLDKNLHNCNTSKEIVKAAMFIGNNLVDESAEHEPDSIINKLYSIYGLKEETKSLILPHQKNIIAVVIGRKLGIRGQLKVDSVNKGNDKGTLYRFNDYKIIYDGYFDLYISIRSVLNETHDIERVYLGFCDSETLKPIAEEYQDFKTTDYEHISTEELCQLVKKLVNNTKGHIDVEWC